MSARSNGKRLALAANILLAASLFLALIWFTASVLLFSLCLVFYGAAWLVDDSAIAQLRAPTAPE